MPPTWIAQPEEAPEVARLLAAFRDWYETAEPDDASFASSVRRLIAEPATTTFLLGATGDGPPSGVVAMRFRFSVWTATDDCWIEDVFVAERSRGSGLGRALVTAALEHARERGCRRAELDVDDVNAPARALYESLGFREKHGGAALMAVALEPRPGVG